MIRPAALALALALLWDGGAHESRPAPVPTVPTVRSALAEVAREAAYPGARDDAWSAAEIERIAGRVRSALREKPDASPVTVLNETVFGALGFVREVDDGDLRFVLLPTVLESRRGGCVGLGTLYLALGEALGWPSAGVIVPGHFFVRMDERGRARNVELLRRGEEMPDSWYVARFGPAPDAAAYMRPLTLSEVVAVIEYDIGGDRRKKGHLFEARAAFQRTTQAFPAFAEAHASLGATLHLLGSLDEAEAMYRAARAANPHLSGLDSNLELLRRERRGDWPLPNGDESVP